MVRVELRNRSNDRKTWQTVATLDVAEDQTWTVSGDRPEAITRLFDVSVPDAAGDRWVRFEDDPASWARGLPVELRGGHVSAVVTEGGDDDD